MGAVGCAQDAVESMPTGAPQLPPAADPVAMAGAAAPPRLAFIQLDFYLARNELLRLLFIGTERRRRHTYLTVHRSNSWIY